MILIISLKNTNFGLPKSIIMSYLEDQRKKAITLRKELFEDKLLGIYKGKEREFVLSIPELNLWEGIRQPAIEYFKSNNISWWGNHDMPSGHLLSSQISCLNHLFILRENQEMASKIVNSISPEFIKACKIDDGFVEFEVTGKENYLNEKSHSRGVYATSIDAMMLAEKKNGERILIPIEWKYTESYKGISLAAGKPGLTRIGIYKPHFDDVNCPIYVNEHEALYYEPYYQLMRQTLLVWKMVNSGEYGASDWLHLHVIPTKNTILRNLNTSPNLLGESMHQAWQNVLKYPEKYRIIEPQLLLNSLTNESKCKEFLIYLNKRYWE